MNVLRVATQNDAEELSVLLNNVGPGLTTVPKDKETLTSYIDESVRFLRGDTVANRVFFVVESDGKIAGMSAIFPHLGKERPYCSFKYSRHSRRSSNPPLRTTHNTLQFSTEFDGNTALATLFLSPDARGGGIGRLLSVGRLAFIDLHRELFSPKIMADIRGWVDEDGEAPFWNYIASRFIDLPFKEADDLSSKDSQFIAELLPSLPILLNLLPKEVEDYIGRPHRLSQRAMSILLSAGFKKTDLCDVFDGGPAIECHVSDTSIARTAKLARHFKPVASETKLICYAGKGLDFRATFAPGDLTQEIADPSCLSALCINGTPSPIFIAASHFTNTRLQDLPVTPSKEPSYGN